MKSSCLPVSLNVITMPSGTACEPLEFPLIWKSTELFRFRPKIDVSLPLIVALVHIPKMSRPPRIESRIGVCWSNTVLLLSIIGAFDRL